MDRSETRNGIGFPFLNINLSKRKEVRTWLRIVFIYLSTYGIFNDAVDTSDYVASNDRLFLWVNSLRSTIARFYLVWNGGTG